jgi:hypothetical protein
VCFEYTALVLAKRTLLPYNGPKVSGEKIIRAMEDKFADCVLISREGREFFSLKGILSTHSPVLRHMFAECVCDSADEKSQVVLEDSSTDLEYLLEEVHGPGSFIFDMCLPAAYIAFSTVSRLKSLTIMAFKYEMKGKILLHSRAMSGVLVWYLWSWTCTTDLRV